MAGALEPIGGGDCEYGCRAQTSPRTIRGELKEATRDGAPPIDLVDGSELAKKLKDLSLGVRKEMIEAVRVDELWFESV